ncbi:MAG: PEP-CTERM sorting domain-containing protein [Oscillatoriales cyanobacterium RM2_1_1]|nr:PEP-CTERM sorting domain-containing protein [Oscillatoriales cyanobacterium SM2_3_0]NJO47023.1 PEP-CTERM sorting domain-containing protein [Oscillatoriales cyanobacterium RM2_1_1]
MNHFIQVIHGLGKRVIPSTILVAGVSLISTPAQAIVGFADTVLEFFDSGAGPIAGPYGGEFPGGIGFPVLVSTDVVLGNDPNPIVDFLSLPTDSFVTVGFTDETVIDGIGNDIFIQEVGDNGERADIFVSSDLTSFTFLGTASDAGITSFDLSSIGFTDPVQAIRLLGLDSLGGSPGFDVVNIQVLPGSIGPKPKPVPEPGSLISLLALGTLGMTLKKGAKLTKTNQLQA